MNTSSNPLNVIHAADRGIPSSSSVQLHAGAPSDTAHSVSPAISILLLDCSGSMGASDWPPTRLDGAKAASVEFIQTRRAIKSNSRIGVVGFGSRATLASSIMPIDPPDACIGALSRLSITGDTNMPAGLELARQEFTRVVGDWLGGCELVVLTDGYSSDEQRALSLGAEIKGSGCVVHVVGIGGNPAAVNEQFLRAIASMDATGQSLYRFISDRDRLVRHFGNIGGGITR